MQVNRRVGGRAALNASGISARRQSSKALRRRRYYVASAPSTLALAAQPERRPVYGCSQCKRRMLDDHRCPDCNRFGHWLGLGGLCPHCDQPVVLTDLVARGIDV